MGRLTKYGKTSHENGVCCTHFMGKECKEVGGECSYGCKWEEEAWSKLAHYEDLEEQGRLIELPCAVGDRLYFTSEKGDVFNILIETIDEALFFKDENGNLKKGFYLTKEEAERKLNILELITDPNVGGAS